MNSKKIFISIFIIIICMLFISNSVFAYTTKVDRFTTNNFFQLANRPEELKIALKSISAIEGNVNIANLTPQQINTIIKGAVSDISSYNGIENLRFTKINIKKNEDSNCTVNITLTEGESSNAWGASFSPHFVIGTESLTESQAMTYLNSKIETSNRSVRIDGTNYVIRKNDFKKFNNKNFIIELKSNLCNNSKLNIFVFYPAVIGGWKANNLYIYDTKKNGLSNDDLIDIRSKFGSFYFPLNADFAMGVPVSSGTSAAATSVDCSTKCSGYTKSTTYPKSSVTVGGQSLSRGQVCYKCNGSGTMADRCNPFNGQKSGFNLNLASYPDLKTEICTNVGATNTSGSSGTPAQNTDAGRGSGGTQTPAECPAEYNITYEGYAGKKFKCVIEGTIPKYQHCSVVNGNVVYSSTLTFENNSDEFKLAICSSISINQEQQSQTPPVTATTLNIVNETEKNISDINFSLNNTNWYMVNKIDNPKEFVLNSKTQDKSISVDLSMFNEKIASGSLVNDAANATDNLIIQVKELTSRTAATQSRLDKLSIVKNPTLSQKTEIQNLTDELDALKKLITTSEYKLKTLESINSTGSSGIVYAIIATTDNKTKIDDELKTIYQTGNFTGYNLQTASNVFEINNTLSLSKLQYTLDNTKKVKLNISNNITNGDLVIIFMQKSADNSKVNLSYANLYVLDNKEQSHYYFCEINKKIVNFYCKGHNCNSTASCLRYGRWDFDPKIFDGLTPIAVEPATPVIPQVVIQPPVINPPVQQPVTFTGNCNIDKQATVEEYITCLRNNIETVNLTTRRYEFVGITAPVVTGNEIINQKYNSTYYSENNACYTNSEYNNAIFEAAKNARLTEEETAQLWGLLATESECNANVTCGDYCSSYGIGQVNNTWNASSSYNTIKPYLIQINSSKYDTFAKYQTIFNKIKTVGRSYADQVSSVEISIAINKYHKSLIVNRSRTATRPFTDDLDKIYDHNDAIDIFFANGYIYSGGIGENFSRVDHFSDGIKIGATRFQGIVYPALRKIGFYLNYKHSIYNCHKTATTNAFVTAYKTKYNGTYCK